MNKFIDANIFIERWSNSKAHTLVDSLDPAVHCTSVLVLAEVYHKLEKKRIEHRFDYVRSLMSKLTVYDISQDDFFTAAKNQSDFSINDKIHIAIMSKNGIQTIISYDKDFDREKTITREEP